MNIGVPTFRATVFTICSGLPVADFPAKSKGMLGVHQLLFLQQSLYPNHRSIFNNKLAESQTSVLEKKIPKPSISKCFIFTCNIRITMRLLFA